MKRLNALLLVALLALPPGAGSPPAAAQQAPDRPIYADALAAGWESWSWDTTVNPANGTPTHAGAASLAATHNAAWAGLYLHSADPLISADYAALRFWVHGGGGGQRLNLAAADANDNNEFGPSVAVGPLAAGWTQVTVTMAQLGNIAAISGFAWMDGTGAAQARFYLDDIDLDGVEGQPPGQSVALTVNAGAGRHAISPDIYGINFADQALAQALRVPLNRWGGNSTSRYNWRTSMTNTGSDWYFENVPSGTVNVANLPNGSATDQFVEQNRATGAQSIITVPAIGWVAKASSPRTHPYACGFKVSSYGAQTSTDAQWDPDCGNGLRAGGGVVTGNNPADTSQQINGTFVGDWVNHLKGRYGAASAG
ncbi:MAG TPA: glycoside hydrolase family 44 protein, partial [Herpetosiphonaceae bacterium]